MSRILLASVLGSGLGGETETKMIRDVSEAEYREGDIVLGRGTNVIVSDSGACGRVLIMRCEGVRFTESGVVAESGAGMSAMALEACRRGLCGLEWAAGLPGSVGGAIVMNAGAYGGEMADAGHLGQLSGQRALARSRGAQEDDNVHGEGSFWLSGGR